MPTSNWQFIATKVQSITWYTNQVTANPSHDRRAFATQLVCKDVSHVIIVSIHINSCRQQAQGVHARDHTSHDTLHPLQNYAVPESFTPRPRRHTNCAWSAAAPTSRCQRGRPVCGSTRVQPGCAAQVVRIHCRSVYGEQAFLE
jgi:hypothetical protein